MNPLTIIAAALIIIGIPLALLGGTEIVGGILILIGAGYLLLTSAGARAGASGSE